MPSARIIARPCSAAALFAQGGEFAFVLYAAALAAGIFDARAGAVMSAIVILSMALTPIVVLLLDRFLPRPAVSMDGIEEPPCLTGRVLIIGFGRFGQVVSQPLLARDVDISIIDADVDMIRAAGNFGFKVYYGDGTRLDVLRASGAGKADAILVCIDKPELADRIVELAKHEFPQAKLYVRSFDRGHSLRLIQAGVDYQVRETFESAMAFGENVLQGPRLRSRRDRGDDGGRAPARRGPARAAADRRHHRGPVADAQQPVDAGTGAADAAEARGAGAESEATAVGGAGRRLSRAAALLFVLSSPRRGRRFASRPFSAESSATGTSSAPARRR